MLQFIDSHCHLDFPEFDEDREEVFQRAASAGVGTLLAIATTLEKYPRVRAVAERANVWCTVGVHPHHVKDEPDVTAARLLEIAADPKVVAFGETGLDYYYEHTDRALQQTSFRAHIAAARAAQLPLVVHTRDAEEDTIAILREEYEKGPFPGLIHCFTASQALADAVLPLGFCLSISGIITFKSAESLRNTVRAVPLERLLIETDAPYLAPLPHRGKRNEPAFVVHTAERLAELKQVSLEEVATATTQNFFRLFTKIQPLPLEPGMD
jgi:TatD DNase family protein